MLLEIMGGRTGEAQTAAFLSALRVKGETAEEIVGMARAMSELAEKVDVDADVILDTCGTGGDRAGTFNISTAAALVAAGAGVTVAKHGNRSATSKCGSADVLEALGVVIDLAPEHVSRCIAACGIGFMFAPRHHLAMKHVAPVRRELGMATTFNLIGPLTNPAGARHQLIGVADARYVDRIAQAVRLMGNDRNLIVHSDDGLDEISTTCPTERGRGVRRPGLRRALRGHAGAVRHEDGPGWRTSPAATRPRTRPSCAPSSTASRGRASTSSCSTPARRCTSRRPPAASPRAWRRRGRRSPPAPPAPSSTSSSRPPGGWPRRRRERRGRPRAERSALRASSPR